MRTATYVSVLKETRLEQRLGRHLIRFDLRTHVQIKVCSVEASCCCSAFPFLENTFHASGMRLYHNTQQTQKAALRVTTEGLGLCRMVPESQQQVGGDLVKPQKLPNPIIASQQHRALHQELLLCHRWGLLPRRKPELQCVLEQKWRERQKQRELLLSASSDLEVKLRQRRQKIQALELEQKRKSEGLQNVPEFVHVRGTLRRVQTFS
ncbi:protein FAM107B [Nelusetta ayraudi]|uniref:protein FAM107B n=1 Tax=Nelusetta ayraudi TaxID=303726 RepID=UPI003F6F50BF